MSEKRATFSSSRNLSGDGSSRHASRGPPRRCLLVTHPFRDGPSGPCRSGRFLSPVRLRSAHPHPRRQYLWTATPRRSAWAIRPTASGSTSARRSSPTERSCPSIRAATHWLVALNARRAAAGNFRDSWALQYPSYGDVQPPQSGRDESGDGGDVWGLVPGLLPN